MKYELTRVPVLPFAMTLARKKCKISLAVINPIFILLTKEHIHSNIHPSDLAEQQNMCAANRPHPTVYSILFYAYIYNYMNIMFQMRILNGYRQEKKWLSLQIVGFYPEISE